MGGNRLERVWIFGKILARFGGGCGIMVALIPVGWSSSLEAGKGWLGPSAKAGGFLIFVAGRGGGAAVRDEENGERMPLRATVGG